MKYIIILLLCSSVLFGQGIEYNERGIPSIPEKIENEDVFVFDSLTNVISQINIYENQIANYNLRIREGNRQISALKSHANEQNWEVQKTLDESYYASVLSFTKYKNDSIIDVVLELRPNSNIRVNQIVGQIEVIDTITNDTIYINDLVILGRLKMVSDEVFSFDNKTFYGVYGRSRKIRWRNEDKWSEWFK